MIKYEIFIRSVLMSWSTVVICCFVFIYLLFSSVLSCKKFLKLNSPHPDSPKEYLWLIEYVITSASAVWLLVAFINTGISFLLNGHFILRLSPINEPIGSFKSLMVILFATFAYVFFKVAIKVDAPIRDQSIYFIFSVLLLPLLTLKLIYIIFGF